MLKALRAVKPAVLTRNVWKKHEQNHITYKKNLLQNNRVPGGFNRQRASVPPRLRISNQLFPGIVDEEEQETHASQTLDLGVESPGVDSENVSI
jgi:hypothetical protein